MYENEPETIDIMEAYAKELYPEDGDDAFYNPEFEKQLSLEYEIIEPYDNAEAMTKKILQDIETYNAGDIRADKGFSPLRAKVAKEFSSIEDIIKESDRLTPKGESEKEGKEGEFELENALSKLSDEKKELFTKPFQDFSEFENFTNYLAYQPKITKKLLTDYLSKNASNGKWAMYKNPKTGKIESMRKTPTLKDIEELLSHVNIEKLNKYFDDEYRKPLTDMFEAKILRNVQVSEWQGAVVPNDLDPKLKDAIKKAGGEMFKLFEYDPKNPETRQEAIDNFKDYRFRFETEYEKITGKKRLRK
jgi:hypothetical protein